MSLKTELLNGKKIKFNSLDIDSWSYDSDQSLLNQWIEGTQTSDTLQVVELNDASITVNWDNGTSTFFEADVELV